MVYSTDKINSDIEICHYFLFCKIKKLLNGSEVYMALNGFVKIRSAQIASATILGSNIASNTIMDANIASNAAIAHTKLALDYAEIFSHKKVVDFVQVNGTAVASGVTKIDVTGSGTGQIPNSTPSVGSDSTSEGVITSGEKNRVPLRLAGSQDPLVAEWEVSSVTHRSDVYGRMTYDAGSSKYELKFYYLDESGDETAYTTTDAVDIDWQYAKRFNLDSVSEMFAANEKFVDGVADTSAHLNILQLAKDVYGPSYTLDRDGNANLARNLVDEILVQTRGVINTTVRASAIIDEVITARGAYASIESRFIAIENSVTDLTNDLASTANGSGGATLVGVSADAGLDGSTVEAVLVSIDSRLDTLENNGGAEVTATHERDAASTNGLFAVDTFVSLEERLVDIENTTDEKFKTTIDDLASTSANKGASTIGIQDTAGNISATTVEGALAEIASEVVTARGAAANLDARLDNIDTAIADEIQDRTDADDLIKSDLASTSVAKGASLVGINDAGSLITASTVEGALQEIVTNLNTEISDRATAVSDEATARSTADQAIRDDLAATTGGAGKGAGAVGIQDSGSLITATTVEGALAEIVTNLNQEIADRQAATGDTLADLASTAVGEGASLVGINDAGSIFSATTVEGALQESHQEVVDGRTSSFFGPTGAGSAHASLDARLEAGETRYEAVKSEVETARSTFASVDARLDDIETDIDDLETEVTNARGTMGSVDARLDVAINENGTLKQGTKIHVHKKYVFTATGGETTVDLPNGELFQLGDDTLDVYVNGVLQAEGIHYAEVSTTNSLTHGNRVDFDPETLAAGDVIIIKWVVNETA